MTLGFAVLAPLLAPSIACRSRSEAQRAGFIALFWGFVAVGLAAATVMLATLSFDATLVGRRPDGIPDSILVASGRGLVSICGQTLDDRPAVRRACIATGAPAALRPEDIAATGPFLLTNLPALRRLGNSFAGLVPAALIALGLALAAAGVQSVASALGHDVIYRIRDRSALTSRRLAISRALALGLIVMAGILVATTRFQPQMLIAWALGLSAAALAPLLALSLWPKARSRDALVTLLAGLFSAACFVHVGPHVPGVERVAAGAVVACAAGLLAGMLTSLVQRGDGAAGKAFVHAILHEEGELLHPDRGA